MVDPAVTELRDVAWVRGAPREPALQVHRHDDHTYVLRQSMSAHWEAPFLFLLLGDERALLLDTGATADSPLRAVLDDLVGALPLLVAHTHAHGDHVAGDDALRDRPATAVIGPDLAGVEALWGALPTRVDLGGRVLEVLATPGHHASSITVFDERTGWLLTGDLVYPGRLYVDDPPAFRESLDRLVGFTRSRPVTAVVGCHLEMTRTPGRDWPIGAPYQPEEPPLPMTVEQLVAVCDAAHAAGDRPGVHRAPDFALWLGPCTWARRRHRARRLLGRLRPHRR